MNTVKARRLSGGLKGATRFYWLRHGPVADAHGMITGQQDFACSLSDTETIAGVGAALPAGAVIVASPLIRARSTVEAIAGRPPVQTDAALMEQDFGRWNGARWADVADEADALGMWEDPAGVAPPDGESFVDLCRRVADFIERAVVTWPDRDVVVGCHAGTVRAALAHGLGLVEAPGPMLNIAIDNFSLTRIDVLPGGAASVGWANWLPLKKG